MRIFVSYFVVFALAMIIIMICLRIINTPTTTDHGKKTGKPKLTDPEDFRYPRDNARFDKTSLATKVPKWEVRQIDSTGKLVNSTKIFDLPYNCEFRIGRMKDNNFVIDEVDDPITYASVSRYHLIIIKDKDDFYAEVCENDDGVKALTHLEGSDEIVTKRFLLTDNLIVVLGKSNSRSTGKDNLKPIRIQFIKY